MFLINFSQISDARSHGRDSSERSSNRSYAELVKWQGSAIRMPLLRLPNDLAPLALECFDCILRYCGDVPMESDLTEVKCVYTVLMVSFEAHFCDKIYMSFYSAALS